MQRLYRIPLLAAAALLGVLACDNDTLQPGFGSIVVQAVAGDAVGSSATAPAGTMPAPAAVLDQDSAYVTVTGPTTKSVKLTKNGTTNFTGTVDQLQAGSYTVKVYWFKVGEISNYAVQTAVNVTANQTSTANPVQQTFVSTPTALSTPTWLFKVQPSFSTVANADSYKVEYALNSNFTSPSVVWTKTPPATITFNSTGSWGWRVRAATSPAGAVLIGSPSATSTVTVSTDIRTRGGDAGSAPDLGFFASTTVTLDSLNIYPATDADWFSVRNCNGDSLTVTVQTVSLSPASPLYGAIRVYDGAGKLVTNADGTSSADAQVKMLLAADGPYKLRVSAASGAPSANGVGHYKLQIVPKRGANNTGASPCQVVALAVTSIAAGNLHTCAVRTSGAVDCWGNNANGQLGNGTTTTGSSATRTSGGLLFASVAAGDFHSCARSGSGVAYCWGYNGQGEVGDGTTTDRAAPVTVSGGLTFQYVGAGALHTCGLAAGGAAYCWGGNNFGQLGNGSNTNSSVPVLVGGAITFTSLAVGLNHACGATSGGAVYCWGSNSDGQLGNGTFTNSNAPVLVSGTGSSLLLQGVAAGGNHSCGRTSSGAAYCWGNNSDGQLGNGDGTFTDQTTPVAVLGGFAFTALTAGRYHSCGLVSGGTAYCWGDGFDGQLGDGSTSGRTSPSVPVASITFQAISGGSYHTCGIQTTSGNAYCWGWNGFGQNGDASGYDWTGPVPVSGGLAYKSISTTQQHSCGVTNGGAAYCWGWNIFGQVGDATNTDRNTPVVVAGTYNLVSTGRYFSCGLTTASAVSCWGSDFYGQLGDGTNTTRNTPVTTTGTYQSLATGAFHTCAISSSSAQCWGYNFYGQLGNATNTDRNTPGPVSGTTTYQSVSAGYYHTCALRSSGGAIDCWGRNTEGQLGSGTTTTRNTPGVVSGTLTFQSVTLGGYHTCALTTSGAAYCWGYNGSGQVGDGSSTNRTTPVAVSGGLVFQAINAGDYHTCGVTTSNALYCWGEAFSGQLGYGGFSDKNAPTVVSGLIPFQAVSAGGGQTCGFATSASSNTGYCWGNNERGQLGNGTRTIQVTPAIVVTGPSAAPPLLTGYPAAEWLRSGARLEAVRRGMQRSTER